MAEISAKNLYGQLSPMGQMYYDQQFSKRYKPGQKNLFLSSQPEYNKMQAVYEAEQQVPEKGIFSIFSSAGAAEPDKINTVSNSPGFQTVANPDGTISVVPVSTSSNLPFSVGEKLFNEFSSTIPNQTSFEPKSIQTIFPTNSQTGIMKNINLPKFDMDNLPMYEKDDSEQEFLPDQKEKSGIAKLFEFLQNVSPVRAGIDALGSLLNFRDSPNYRPAGMGVYGYTPEQLNQMNALGGYYSDPMRAYRRNTNRISNLMRRAAAGKNYSQKNLDTLMKQAGMGDVDTGGMIDSIKASSQTGYGGFGSREAASEAAASGGRDYSSSPGAMAGDMEYGEE